MPYFRAELQSFFKSTAVGPPAFQTEFSTLVSADEYLRLDAEADGKLEFTNGLVWAMAGADPAHNEINYNLNQAIEPQLRRQGCKGYMGDQRAFLFAN